MKKLICVILLLSVALALCACGGQESAATTAATSAPVERTGIAISKDPVIRGTETVLQTPNTIEAWIKLPAADAGRADIVLSTEGDAYDFNSFPYVTLYVDTNGEVVLDWACDAELSYSWRFKGVNLRTDQWTHLAVVRHVEDGRIYCYLNGELAAEYKERYSMDLVPHYPYCIGGDYTHKNERYFTGEIHSVALFTEARTADEIKADMTAPEGESLLMSYKLTESLEDQSGNGHDLISSTRWFTEKEAVTDYAYSFMVVPDTQIVAVSEPEKLDVIYDYIVENAASRNVKFVMGMGDITNDDTYTEWNAATAAIFQMDGVVPYSLVRGNTTHDSPAKFNEAFPMSKYADRLGGCFKEGDMRNVYHLFEVGDVKYMVLVLDCSPTDEMIAWANEVVAANPDRNVILTTHVYLNKDGTTMSPTDFAPGTPNTGDDIWEKLVRKHENIVLVMCGHDSSSRLVLTQTQGDKGNTVSQLLLNGQGVEDDQEGNCGFVATLYFSEDGKNVTVEYYSTLRKQYFLTENQFSFTLDLID